MRFSRFPREGKDVLRVAIPSVASMAIETLLGFVDTFWVSRLGNDAVAAISASTYLIWVIFSLIDMVAVGLVSLSAYYTGRRDRRGFSSSFYTGFYSVLSLSFLISAFLLLNLHSYVSLFKLNLRASLWLADYLFIQLVFLPLAGLYYLVSSAFEGAGRTKEVFYSSILVLLSNSLLDPVLIFGLGLELKGAAISSIAARALGLIFLRGRMSLERERFSFTLLGKMLKVGTASSVYWLSTTGVFLFLNALASRIEPLSVAAMGVGVRYETIPYIIAMGISVGASSVVGRCKGAENFKSARKAAEFSLFLALFISLFLGLIFYGFASPLAGFFLKGRARDIAVLYLRISALSQIFFSLTVVFEGIFVGLGKTFPPLAYAIIIVFLRIPLSLLFSSLLWIFVVFPITNLAIAAIFLLYLLRFFPTLENTGKI